MFLRITKTSCTLASFLAFAPLAHAAVTVTVESNGTDVTFNSTGSIDLGPGATPLLTTSFNAFVEPNYYAFLTGQAGTFDLYAPNSFFGEPIGPGTATFNADAGTGPLFGVTSGGGTNPGFFVPQGYTSGTPITSTATYLNQTYESMGLAPGSYEYRWQKGTSTSAESVFVNILPEPATGQVWQIDFTGTVSPTTTLNTATGAPATGDPVTLTVLVDPGRPDSDFTNDDSGLFRGSMLSATVTTGDVTYQSDDFYTTTDTNEASIRTELTADVDPLSRMRLVSLDTTGPVDTATGSDGNQLILDLFNQDENALGDLDEFADLTELNAFLAGLHGSSTGSISFAGSKVSTRTLTFSIDSASATLVPEPTSLALLGLGGLLVARRR